MMKRMLLGTLVVLIGAVALFALAPGRVLNAIALAGGAVVTERDIAFGPDPRLRLDIYRPANAAGAPVVIFFYGGSWQRGEKASFAFIGAALAHAGIVAVIPNYRIYPPVVYPDFLRDSALAVRWTKENANRFGGDPAKLFLSGHSAGAYNAAMLNLDPRWLGEVKLDPRRDLRGAIGIAGPYDFLPLESAELKIIFGPEDARPATQPIAYADGTAPPMLLLRPAKDSVVDPGNSERLAAKIRSKGGDVLLETYDRVGHITIIGTFSPLLSFLAPVRDDLIRFVFQQSKRPAT
jgi:acetyl esterase/lipase